MCDHAALELAVDLLELESDEPLSLEPLLEEPFAPEPVERESVR